MSWESQLQYYRQYTKVATYTHFIEIFIVSKIVGKKSTGIICIEKYKILLFAAYRVILLLWTGDIINTKVLVKI